MLYKNLPPAHWRRIFPLRALLDGVALLRALLTGQGREAAAIFRAYHDAHRLRREYTAERPTAEEIGTPPSYRGSIVIDYFLRGRHRFSELPEHRLGG